MKSICFIVPYFGKLPDYFQVWLDTCRTNPTVDWLVFTDDNTNFSYPNNVKMNYCSFADIKTLIQKNFEFKIVLKTAYKLCDYKVAYGEIFKDYLIEYDFWGFCDIDLMWGEIRKFYTEEIMNHYQKIGCQGHATIFKNSPDVNAAYKTDVAGNKQHKEIYTEDKIGCTDVGYITRIFSCLKLPAYMETIYAGLQKYDPGFYLQAEPKELGRFNRRQVFVWENGKLTRFFLDGEKVCSKEYLYIHFFSRPMKNKIKKMDRILIYPDCYMNFYDEVEKKIVKKYGKKSEISYYFRVFKQNTNRLSIRKVISYFITKMRYEIKKRE